MFKKLKKTKSEIEKFEFLSVGCKGKKTILLRRKTILDKQIIVLSTSKDGVKFSERTKEVVIKNKDRSKEDVSLCSNFRLAENEGGLFMTYVFHEKAGKKLHYATSKDGETWHVQGKIKDVGFPASAFFGPISALYFGSGTLHAAISKNLKTWTIEKPSHVPYWHFSDGRPVQVIGTVVVPEGIAVFYKVNAMHDIFTDVNLRNEKVGEKHFVKIGAALFSAYNPLHLLWQSEVPIAELDLQKGQEATFLGIVPVLTLVGKRKLRIYVVKVPGEVGFIEFSEEILANHYKHKPVMLNKSEDNPIICPTLNDWENQGTFNPAAIQLDNKVHFVYRAVGEDGTSRFGYASSSNGSFVDERQNFPVYTARKPFEKLPDGKILNFNQSMFGSGGSWGGCEDPKLTRIDDRIYMTYVAHVGTWPMRTALTSISVKDFKNKRWNWTTPMLMSAPNVGSKSVVILPEKVKGNYVIFHRIWPNIIVDFVPELVFGEGIRWLGSKGHIPPRHSFWDSQKLSMGSAPIKTNKGWLSIYNAVDRMDSSRYKIGAMLLSLSDPRKVIARTRKPILSPDEWYENDGKPGIAYPSGAVLQDDILYVYYGGADKVSCLATFPIDQLLWSLEKDVELNCTLTPIFIK
ncbi:MAG: hypothetical protein EXS46_00055 [Candidatus Taylorbacteria bacterium]|nr:hypothetical protein [Candidatus Taylorbacteria bacterium]